jgi:hypothetical protein
MAVAPKSLAARCRYPEEKSMNRLLRSSIAAALLLAPAVARADAPFNPDCHLQAINASLDSVREQIKSSPALGHAAGHYRRALEDVERTRKQLHEGCRAWNNSLKR